MNKYKELFPLNSELQSDKDVKEIISYYTKRWKLFALMIIGCLVAAFIYINFFSTPKYSITSSILIKENAPVPTVSNFVSLNGQVGFDASNNLSTVVELLKSKALMKRTISDLGLTTSYFVDDKEIYSKDSPIKVMVSKIDSTILYQPFGVKIQSRETYILTDNTGKDVTLKFGQEVKGKFGALTILTTPSFSDNSSKEISFYFNNPDYLVDKYIDVLTVKPFTDKASLLQVTITDEFPERGKDVINKLLGFFQRESFDSKSRAIDNTIAFLDERLSYFTKSLSGVERKVEEYKRRNELTDVSSQASNYVNQADAYTRNISEWAIQIDILESIEKYLNESPNEYKLVPSTLGIKDGILLSLINKLNELQLERENVLRSVKSNSPLIKSINEQISNLRQNILENLNNVKNGLIIERENYRENSEKFKAKVSKVPTIERDLLEINRQQSIRQNIYLYLLQKREESTIAKSAIVPDSEVVDPAMVDPIPVSPKKMIIFLVAFIVGIALPFTFLYAKSQLNNKIQSGKEAAGLLNTYKIAEIPNSYQLSFKGAKSNDPLTETFEFIRASLLYDKRFETNKAFLVTSSRNGEGKTFFSLNLAKSLSLIEKKVVLVELDFRAPSLDQDLNLSIPIGVSNYLNSNELNIIDIIQPASVSSNLSIISAGTNLANPSESLMTLKLSHLIYELKQAFDYVVIDSSAIGEYADALVISAFADTNIMITRDNYTTKDDLIRLKTIILNNNIENPIMVYNGIVTERKKTFVDFNKKKVNRKNKISI